ncbi:hypothetical protein HDU86_001734 [Geranomyces michiganensis]|nr:hypothetical protein HDU86_001734 [Geranomyces michiganensis]
MANAPPPTPALLPIDDLNNVPLPEFSEAISLLFEPAPPLAAALYARRPFTSYTSLLDTTQSILLGDTLSPTDRLQIVNAHPRIGEAKQNLSAMSHAEQGYTSSTAAAVQEEDPGVMDKLRVLNKAYEDKYGFRFLVFVNGRSKKDIVPVMEKRLHEGTREGELVTGLTDMVLIAKDRLRKLQRE